jgi:protein-tyrosine phosphatase
VTKGMPAGGIRHLALAGADNFRDCGGYTTSDGRTVAWGRLFRSGHLGRLTRADVTAVERLGIRLVCDLRAPAERVDLESRLPTGAPPRVVSIPVDFPALDPGRVRRYLLGRDFAAGALAETVLASYRAYPTDFAPAFATVLRTLAEADGAPALIHCNGGKDRTGFAVALVLLTLGVPRSTILQDYLLTNHCTRWTTRRRVWLVYLASRLTVRPSEMRALLEAREPYLEAAFDVIENRHGSIERYLREALGLSDDVQARLREAFLA